jgi:hypothetical protein
MQGQYVPYLLAINPEVQISALCPKSNVGENVSLVDNDLSNVLVIQSRITVANDK